MLIHNGKCDCVFCNLSRRIRGLIRRQTTLRDKQMIVEITNRLTHAEDDADYWRLRFFKAWPPSQYPKPAKPPGKGWKCFAPTKKELYEMAKQSRDGRAELRRSATLLARDPTPSRRIGAKAK